MALSQTRRLPVTVVTGFLGAGKTTLLRHLLVHSGQRLAVVVNEFGEVGIDGDLLRRCGFCHEDELEGRLVELANGCLCCTVQDDFLPTMQTLLDRAESLDGILVETSGLALPEPLLAAFNWPEIRSRTWVSGVVAVVDGEALAAGSVVADPAALEAQRLADASLDHAPAIEALFEEQLESADLVLVSRADCLMPGDLERLIHRLQPSIRAGTAILPMHRGRIDPQLVIGLERTQRLQAGADQHHDDHHQHDHSHVAMESMALRLEGQLERQALEAALLSLIRDFGLIRVKGRLWLPGKTRPLEIQAVGPRLESWFADTAGSDAGRLPSLDLVLLGFRLPQAELRAAVESLLSPAPA
jgi:cobalamin biosynthesis protein CobW